MMRTIHLHGQAGKLFGKKFRLDVDSLDEAVRALCLQIEGLGEYIRKGFFKVVRRSKNGGRLMLGEDQITMKLGEGDIHITPVLEGRGGGKSGGLLKILAGVLLLGFAFFAPAMVAGMGMTASQLGMMGVGLILAGISSLLSPQPKDDEEEKKSGMFSGVLNPATQGQCMPVAYGRTVWRDLPIISQGIISSDVATAKGGDDDK